MIYSSLLLLLVHPCDKKNKGGCEQICNKKGDGVICSCENGYKLFDDKKSCVKSMLCFSSISLFIVGYNPQNPPPPPPPRSIHPFHWGFIFVLNTWGNSCGVSLLSPIPNVVWGTSHHSPLRLLVYFYPHIFAELEVPITPRKKVMAFSQGWVEKT